MMTVQPGISTSSTSLKVIGPRRPTSPPKPHHPVKQPPASSSPAKKRRLEENAVANRLHSRSSGQRAPPQGICAFCLMPAPNPKDGPKILISCFECGSSGHPHCLRWGRNPRKIKVVQSYEWRCIECKKCEICRDKGDDAQLMFCDRCDRGWHLYCLTPPLEKPPRGQWTCPTCHQLEGHLLSIASPQHLQSLGVPPEYPLAASYGPWESGASHWHQQHSSSSGHGRGALGLSYPGPLQPSSLVGLSNTGLAAKAPRSQQVSVAQKGRDKATPTTTNFAVMSSLKNGFLNAAGSLFGLSPASSWSAQRNVVMEPADTPNKSQRNGMSSDGKRGRGRPPKQKPSQSTQNGVSKNGSQSGRNRKSQTYGGGDDGSDRSGGSPRDRLGLLQGQEGESEEDEASEPEEDDPFGGVLTGPDANTHMYRPTAQDIERFEHGKRTAEGKLGGSLASLPGTSSGRVIRRPSVAANTLASATASPRYSATPLETPSSSRFPRSQLIPSSVSPSATPAPGVAAQLEISSIATSAETGTATPIKCIRFGEFDIDTWYQAPYPEEYSMVPDGRLWICEYCLKYMKSRFMAQRHRLKCKMRNPPGDEIYRDGNICVYEVDGRKNKIYCQNLCLLAKMFLDHKTLYYDVEPFLFYIVTEGDSLGDHFVGYFSKEKRSPLNYNVSCIMTLPVRQRRGWGNFLIDISFLLSKKENRTGSPEKPLSDLGLLSYRNYWTLAVFYFLRNAPEQITLEDISNATAMQLEDIFYVLREQDMIVVYDGGASNNRTPATSKYRTGYPVQEEQPVQPRGRGRPRLHPQPGGIEPPSYKDRDKNVTAKLPTDYHIHFDRDYVIAHLKNYEAKGYVKVRAEKLKWTPFLVSRSFPQPIPAIGTTALVGNNDGSGHVTPGSRAFTPTEMTANLGFSVLNESLKTQRKSGQSGYNTPAAGGSRPQAESVMSGSPYRSVRTTPTPEQHKEPDAMYSSAPSSPSGPHQANGARARPRKRPRALLDDEDEGEDTVVNELPLSSSLAASPLPEHHHSGQFAQATDQDAEGSSDLDADADGSEEDAPGSDDLLE